MFSSSIYSWFLNLLERRLFSASTEAPMRTDVPPTCEAPESLPVCLSNSQLAVTKHSLVSTQQSTSCFGDVHLREDQLLFRPSKYHIVR